MGCLGVKKNLATEGVCRHVRRALGADLQLAIQSAGLNAGPTS